MCQANSFPYRPRNNRPANVDTTTRGRRYVLVHSALVTGNRMKRWRAAIGRLGILSLVLVVVGPACLHLAERNFLRTARRAAAIKPHWPYPDWDWVLDAVLLYTSLVPTLSCWFAWAENGVDQKPKCTKLAWLCLGFVLLNVAWDPIVFGLGGIKVGLLASAIRLGLAVAISRTLVFLNWTACTWVFASASWSFIEFVINIKLLFLVKKDY